MTPETRGVARAGQLIKLYPVHEVTVIRFIVSLSLYKRFQSDLMLILLKFVITGWALKIPSDPSNFREKPKFDNFFKPSLKIFGVGTEKKRPK